jgi:hypothetical protein
LTNLYSAFVDSAGIPYFAASSNSATGSYITFAIVRIDFGPNASTSGCWTALSATPSNLPTPSNSPGSQSSSGASANTSAIVGGVIGTIVVLGIIAIAFLYLVPTGFIFCACCKPILTSIHDKEEEEEDTEDEFSGNPVLAQNPNLSAAASQIGQTNKDVFQFSPLASSSKRNVQAGLSARIPSFR